MFHPYINAESLHLETIHYLILCQTAKIKAPLSELSYLLKTSVSTECDDNQFFSSESARPQHLRFYQPKAFRHRNLVRLK